MVIAVWSLCLNIKIHFIQKNCKQNLDQICSACLLALFFMSRAVPVKTKLNVYVKPFKNFRKPFSRLGNLFGNFLWALQVSKLFVTRLVAMCFTRLMESH